MGELQVVRTGVGRVMAAGVTREVWSTRFLAATAPDVLRFAAITSAASMLALNLAIVAQIDSPSWAATTVLIVAQRVPGQVVGKGIYRALGTIAGAAAGTVLVGLFAQMPELFVAALAAWIAICTATATLLRGFRSYGAVLAGYTAAIVAVSAVGSPDQVFGIAASRAAGILLGILCGAMTTALLVPGRSGDVLLAALRRAIGSAADLLGAATLGEPVAERRRALVGELAAIEALREAANAEDLRLRRRRAGAPAVLGEVLNVFAALRSLDDHLANLAPDSRRAVLASGDLAAIRAWTGEVRDTFAGVARVPAALSPPPAAAGEPGGTEAGRALLLRRAEEAVAALARADAAYRYLVGASAARPSARLGFHRDTAQAVRNGLRAFMSVGFAGAFWIASAWNAGGTFTTNVCVACSLFATQPRPSAAAFGFMRGAAMAILAAFVTRFAILPWLNDFALLATVLIPVTAIGIVATTVPGWTGTATAFSVLYLSTIGPTNVMTYQPAQTVESGIATLAAFVLGGTIFRIVLPSDPEALARRLARELRRDLRRLMAGRRFVAFSLSTLYDRVGQIAAIPGDPERVVGAAATLGLAVDVLRLRGARLTSAARHAIDALLSELATAPDRAGERVAATARDLLAGRASASAAEAAALLDAATTLSAIADRLRDQPGLLAPEGRVA